MIKQGSVEYAAVKEAAELLTKLAAERDEYKEKVATFELRERATKIAQLMDDKGLLSEDETVFDRADNLVKQASAGKTDFDVLETAINLRPENYGSKLASVVEDSAGSTGGSAQSANALKQLVMG